MLPGDTTYTFFLSQLLFHLTLTFSFTWHLYQLQSCSVALFDTNDVNFPLYAYLITFPY